MKIKLLGFLAIAIGALLDIHAAPSSPNTLTYLIPTVQAFSINGTPTFTFTTPTAGQDFSAVTDASSTYNVTTNLGAGKGKITGALSAALPTGLSLNVTFAVPSTSGGTNVANATLSTTATTVMNGLNNGAYPSVGLTYVMSALVGTAAVVSNSTITATYTFLQGP